MGRQDGLGTTHEVNIANAARIVACVNALAGVADPAALVAAARGVVKVWTSKATPESDGEFDGYMEDLSAAVEGAPAEPQPCEHDYHTDSEGGRCVNCGAEPQPEASAVAELRAVATYCLNAGQQGAAVPWSKLDAALKRVKDETP